VVFGHSERTGTASVPEPAIAGLLARVVQTGPYRMTVTTDLDVSPNEGGTRWRFLTRPGTILRRWKAHIRRARDRPVTSRLTAVAAYAMLCTLWGSTWLAIRFGLEGAPPFLAAALRFAVAFEILVPVIAWRRSRLPRGRTEWGLVLFVGVVLFTIDYGLIYWGEANGVQSGLAAILFATFVLQTAAFAHILLPSERLTARKLVGIGVGFGGILLIFRGELGGAGLDRLLPMLAIVLSATCAAVSSVATKRWGHNIDQIPFTALTMVVGAAGLFTLSLAAGERWIAPTWPVGVLAILYLAVAGSVVTFVTYWWLLKRIEATSASYIAMVTPIVALFLGFGVGSEKLDPLALAGTAITLAGIYVAVNRGLPAWVRRRKARAADPSGPGR